MNKIGLVVTLFIFHFFPLQAVLAQEKVGFASEIAGKVLVSREAGKNIPLELKSEVFLHDTVETKKDGIVKLSLKDGTDLVLRENSKVMVTEFLFQPRKGQRHTVLEILHGKIRAVVSKTFNPKLSTTELRTPTAVVGVRGTELALDVTRRTTNIYCLKGRIEAFGKAFPMKAITVVAGTFTNVVEGALPTLPIPIPVDILDEIENQFNIPTSLESVKDRGLDEIRRHLPGF